MPAPNPPKLTSSDTGSVLLSDLIPDPRNARRHGDRNLAQLEESLSELGAARSIVVDEDGTILAGNATVTAATSAGISRVRIVDVDGSELVAVRRSNLSPEQKVRLALLDNRTAELAEWDTDVLASLSEEFDLSLLWDDDELADLLGGDELGTEPLVDPDEVPEPPDDPVTKPGDLWFLGNHKLLCGDSTRPETLSQLMDSEKATCLWTDPPYGVSYIGKTKDALTIANDTGEGLEGLLTATFTSCTDVLAPGASFYIAHPAGPLSLTFQQVLTHLGWTIRQTLVWVKDSLVLGHSDYHYRHEPILYGFLPIRGTSTGRRGRGGNAWYGDDSQTTVFEVPRPKRSEQHPTMKPVALIEAMLLNSTRPGDLVLDPFGGSGSTLIAGELTRRHTRLVEIDPVYCDVIVRRFEDVTGMKAARENRS